MQKKLAEFNELQMHEKREDSLEVTKKKVRVDQIDGEIKILVERILSANAAAMEYINQKIEELDSEKTVLKKEIAEMSADIYGRKMLALSKVIYNSGIKSALAISWSSLTHSSTRSKLMQNVLKFMEDLGVVV